MVEHFHGKEKVIGSIPINGSMSDLFRKIKPYRDIIENVLSLGFIFLAILILFYVFDLSDVQGFVDRFGVWAPIVFALTKASTLIFAPLSGSPLYPAAGALFGFWEGFGILMVGDVVGGTIAFYISRTYGIKITKRFIKNESSMLHKLLNTLSTLKGYIFARICFIPMPEVVCYAAGLTKMSYFQFITVHLLVNIPATAILVGSGVLLTQSLSPLFLIGMAITGTIAIVFGGIWFYKKTK